MAARSKLERDRGYTQADIEAVSDTPEFTEEEMAKAKPFTEVFPELAASGKRTRGKQRAPTKQLISLRLDRTVVEAFKADGPGWQRRMNEALKSAVRRVPSSTASLRSRRSPPAPDKGRAPGRPGRSGPGPPPRTQP